MKRCPECRRDYYDETLLYCLDDGNALLEGPGTSVVSEPGAGATGFPSDEPQTAILHGEDTGSRAAADTDDQATRLIQDLPTALTTTRRRLLLPIIAAATIVVLAIMGGASWYLIPRKPVPPGLNMQMAKLVSGLKGIPGDVSISPDGKYVAYSLEEDGKSGLWLRQLSQDASIPVVPAAENVNFFEISFSPDNELIYFCSAARGQFFSSIYSVPVVGGKEPKKIRENAGDTGFSLSPDGAEIAFTRLYAETGEYTAFVAKTDGSGEERKVLSRSGDDWLDSIAWSPDGKYIASGFATVTAGFSTWIALVPTQGGEPIPLGTNKFGSGIRSLTWLQDGTGLVATTAMSGGAERAVWHISYPDGAVERITKDVNAYFAVDVTADGKTAVMGYGDFDSSLWVIGPDGAGRKIAQGSDDGREGVAYLSDGRIIYTTSANDENNLWIMNGDGSAAKALTGGNTGAFISPSVVSPDGKTIVFTSIRPDNVSHIWRINVDGREPTQLTTNESSGPMFSRDGKWIVYTEASPTRRLMKMPAAGGEPTPVSETRQLWNAAGFSEDGKFLTCNVNDNGQIRTALIELETGKFAGYVDLPPTAGIANFSRSGREYIYIQTDQGLANLWAKPVGGGTARQLTKFTDGFLNRFADAPDGKSYVVTRSHGTNEIVIARNFR